MDSNQKIASLLRDLASVQQSAQSKWGYKRAASAILNLDRPIEQYLLPDGTLRKIPNIGPSSTRVILEVLLTGRSATVDAAFADSPRADDDERTRGLRENFLSRAQVLEALADQRLRGPRLKDYRGDLQMHSTWSDGVETLETLIEACVVRGYGYCAITDHSYGLSIAGGVSMADLARQHQEIEALNTRFAGRFRMIKGIEANIRADGSVDMTNGELRTLELVVAAPHSALRTGSDQTARMIAAVRQQGVHILGHPRGRKLSTRPGVTANWDLVFEAAAESGVAVEIDGDPSRQDIDFTLAKRAIQAGCLFALDSDAHSSRELEYAETAVAHARLAGVPKARVINTWEVDRLLSWAAERSSVKTRRRSTTRRPRV
jgi:histidinol phosphatase-like PHP family hydrolase